MTWSPVLYPWLVRLINEFVVPIPTPTRFVVNPILLVTNLLKLSSNLNTYFWVKFGVILNLILSFNANPWEVVTATVACTLLDSPVMLSSTVSNLWSCPLARVKYFNTVVNPTLSDAIPTLLPVVIPINSLLNLIAYMEPIPAKSISGVKSVLSAYLIVLP